MWVGGSGGREVLEEGERAGVWDRTVCAPTMARPDFPNVKIPVFPTMVTLVWGAPPMAYGHSTTSRPGGGGGACWLVLWAVHRVLVGAACGWIDFRGRGPFAGRFAREPVSKPKSAHFRRPASQLRPPARAHGSLRRLEWAPASLPIRQQNCDFTHFGSKALGKQPPPPPPRAEGYRCC